MPKVSSFGDIPGTYNTSYTVKINKMKYDELPGSSLIHPVGKVNGMFWYVYLYLCGDVTQNKNFLVVKIFYEEKFSVKIDAELVFCNKKKPFKFGYENNYFRGIISISHADLKNAGIEQEDRVEFKVNGTFVMPAVGIVTDNIRPLPPTTICMYELLAASHNANEDVALIVGEEKTAIKVHRKFLSLISPVFEAMLNGNTKEALTGRVEIIDFDFDIVKDGIDLCYGFTYENRTTVDTLEVLRFADKYQIEAICNKLNSKLFENLDAGNFYSIAKYAWMYELNSLKNECKKYWDDSSHLIYNQTEHIKLEKGTQEDLGFPKNVV